MELMQLEMFVAVVEERSITKAAERARRTQPAVSCALSKLEREIGTLLVDRSRSQSFGLTKAGALLYEYASRIIVLRNEALSLLQGQIVGSTGRLCIGVSGAATLRWVSRFTGPFSQQYPEVRVELLCDRPAKLISDLIERRIDFALFPAQPEGLERSADLVTSSISGFEHERPLWVLDRRAGSSHLKKAFEEMLLSSPTRSAGPDHSRFSKADAYLRKSSVGKSR
jgi:DNA-binding transcriptional LysR family regulator